MNLSCRAGCQSRRVQQERLYYEVAKRRRSSHLLPYGALPITQRDCSESVFSPTVGVPADDVLGSKSGEVWQGAEAE